MDDNKVFDIGADVNADAIVAAIRDRVNEKAARGVYADPRVAVAERRNLANLTDQDGFLEFYLACLGEGVQVDINDFDIVERRRGLGYLLVPFKKFVWKILKFYTYRMWSQQNQVNGMLMSAVEAVGQSSADRIRALEKRLAALEKAGASQ